MCDNPTAARPAKTSRRWLLLTAKLLVLALVVWFVRRTIGQALTDIGQHPLKLAPELAGPLGPALPAGPAPRRPLLAPHAALPGTARRARRNPTRQYFIGHLGKYVPGKAMVIVLRSGLLRTRPLDMGLVVASIFLATLSMMAVGACLAAALTAYYLAGQLATNRWAMNRWTMVAAALAMLLVAGLPTLPPVFVRLARLVGVARGNPAALAKLAGLRYRLLAGGWLMMAAGWLFMAGSLWAVLRAIGGQGSLPAMLPLCTAAVSLAVVGGFVAMVPGGLGVRDFVLMELLGRQLGSPGLGLIAAAVLRIVWLVTEILVSIIVYLGGKWSVVSGRWSVRGTGSASGD